MDTLDAMRAYLAVATEGSFTRAADKLATSPQLISKYVARLEERLGVRLLNRTTRRVHLTEAGTQYYQRVQVLLDGFDDLENQVGGLQSEPRGQLRISAPVSFAVSHLSQLVSDYQQKYPQVGVDLQLNDRKVDIVEEGFDIALRIGQLKDSSLVARFIAPIHLVYCASPEYLARNGEPLTRKALKDHKVLNYSYREQGAEVDAAGYGSVASNNGDFLVQCATLGEGIALQPTFICAPALKDGRLKVILGNESPDSLGLYAVYAHRKLLASKVRSFVEFLDGYFGDPPYWDAVE